MYELKPNVADFEVVDGTFAGRKYRAGVLYKEVPPEEVHKFITEPPPPEGGQMSPDGGGVGGGKKKKEVNKQ